MSSKIKIVVVGDRCVGKTFLLLSYLKGIFPEDYMPAVFDNYSVQAIVDDTKIELNLWDTAGKDDYERSRQFVYPNADAIFICFSVVSRISFQNVSLKWIKEIRHNAQKMLRE